MNQHLQRVTWSSPSPYQSNSAGQPDLPKPARKPAPPFPAKLLIRSFWVILQAFQGADSLLDFEFSHVGFDPHLEVIAEPLLEIVGSPDRWSFEVTGRGRPGRQPGIFGDVSPLIVCLLDGCFEETSAHQQAEMASAIKLQVTVDGSGRKSVCRRSRYVSFVAELVMFTSKH
jgi:hypothetical protein